uniref:Uncharacterized protein n=1 Tax=Acrobeloides nanus TaxID=290746 RepID=A0A914EDL1_9BILA
MFWTIQNQFLNLAFIWWYSDYYKQALADTLGPFDFLFVHNVKEERPRISPKEIIELHQMIKPKKKTIVTLVELNLTKATFISDFMEECQNLNISSDNFIFLRLDETVNLLEN